MGTVSPSNILPRCLTVNNEERSNKGIEARCGIYTDQKIKFVNMI